MLNNKEILLMFDYNQSVAICLDETDDISMKCLVESKVQSEHFLKYDEVSELIIALKEIQEFYDRED